MDDLKKLVAEDDLRIKLHDRIASNLKKLFEEFESEAFSKEVNYTPGEFKSRIQKCEELVKELCLIHALIGFWGTEKHLQLHIFTLENIAYQLKDVRGNRVWTAVKWHAVQLIFFYAGLAITARNDSELLFQLFNTKIISPATSEAKTTIPEALLYVNSELDSVYDNLIEQAKHKVPQRQHIFNQVQKNMTDIIFLGNRFEDTFYRFEIIFALEYINRRFDEIGERVWGPVGLFGFEYYGYNPFDEFIEEAQQKEENWELLKAGFFDGDYNRFQKICTSFQENLHRLRF
ncbi:hypothetical protein [Gracilimonas sp.]|uniref:hypothetical protein n=1 Tax=Gracilimonas sp. TaxID=1974203 RepID=UPI003BAC0C4F